MIKIKRKGSLMLALVGVLLLTSHAQAQLNLPFPIYNPMNPGQNLPQSFDLGDPTNLQQGIVYDPETGKYIFTETIGNGLFYRYPSMMSLEDYLEFQEKKSQTLDWQEIIEEETAENRQFELPIKVGSKIFENFFGSDEIKIIPGGNLEISLGANHSRVDNPMLPLRQRRITRFDFNQNINLDVTGQIGTKLKLTMRYNTAAQFDFNNFSNIKHTGREDEILQEIALGNVQLNLPTTLIQGSQTLFGVKTQLKFGRATWDLIAAQSKGKRTEINVSGKAQVQEFQLSADNYEQNRHYFLNLYHQQHYDTAMASLPVVNSTAYITRIEVWITNRNSSTENTRNVLAFADLGEALQTNCQGSPGAYSTSSILPDNQSNGLYNWAANQPLIRGFANAVSTLSSQVTSPGPFQQAIHYEKVENARKLGENEFTYNALLGYISLNNSYNNDEVIAVAYEYTYNG
ncbi:MAG: cell surface protein SprA, partial [Crocinitomicaceae bacterium]